MINRREHIFNIWFSWTGVVFYASLIFSLSSMSRPVPFALKYNADKLLHGIEYLVLGALLARAMRVTWQLRSWVIFWASLTVVTLYGISDEWHQSFVPMRTASAADATADSFGAAVGTALWTRQAKKSRQQRTKRKKKAKRKDA